MRDHRDSNALSSRVTPNGGYVRNAARSGRGGAVTLVLWRSTAPGRSRAEVVQAAQHPFHQVEVGAVVRAGGVVVMDVDEAEGSHVAEEDADHAQGQREKRADFGDGAGAAAEAGDGLMLGAEGVV